MTEQTAQEDGEELVPPTADIEFRARVLTVRMPRPEQILVWRRTLAKLQSANPESWSGAEVMAVLERTRVIIDSLLVNDSDVDWLDGEMLAGRVHLKDTAVIVTDALKAFQNRSERRESEKAERRAPAKKATRKRAK